MTTIYRDEILFNRKKWIKFLKDKRRKKATGILENFDVRGARCCLGHGAFVMGIERTRHKDDDYCYITYGKDNDDEMAPPELVEMVGLWTQAGSPNKGNLFDRPHGASLAEWNDDPYENPTPREIGEYLESVIEGGGHTPFKPLTDYPERPAVDEGT